MSDKTGAETAEVYVPKCNGRPLRPGWWVIDFNCDPGYRYWTGEVWRYAGFDTPAEDYRRCHVIRRARARDLPRHLVGSEVKS